MRGQEPTIRDINLNLEELVLPANLLSDEDEPPVDDVSVAEEERQLFRVDTSCANCETGIRVIVYSTNSGVRRLFDLLLEDLSFVCPGCARSSVRHGRSN
ncbi:E7 protein [Human papillomavirus type 212]|uniref:Protein E7 n=1 Tax=Human papillomavirus type 212 TaxID=2060136 RepID=A0A2H4V8D9_9PAPI|nr:E7 protein [Human papillomavirus type 212]